MDESVQALEHRLQATVTPAERRRARRDAWQVLQLLRLRESTRDLRVESEDQVSGDGSEVA